MSLVLYILCRSDLLYFSQRRFLQCVITVMSEQELGMVNRCHCFMGNFKLAGDQVISTGHHLKISYFHSAVHINARTMDF